MYPLKTNVSYDPENLDKTENTFITVYLGNYIQGNTDEYAGSHVGVDIVPLKKNDDVFAILDAEVSFAGYGDANGNYVVLKHSNVPDPDDFSKMTELYSCYLHLCETPKVAKGDVVKEGDIIGRTGSTGNSTGEHLHFQIDRATAPFHPYWPFTFKEAQDAGLGFYEAVNHGLGMENGRMYTVNPLVYLNRIPSKRTVTPQGNLGTSTTPPSSASKSRYFKDVRDFAQEIDTLKEMGVVNGYAGGLFMPNGNITRVELLLMVLRFAKIPVNPSASCSFSDVDTTDPYFTQIGTAYSKGIIRGYSDGTFRPNNPINRIEASAIALNAVLGKARFTPTDDSEFPDVTDPNWVPYANYIRSNGLLSHDGAFRPYENMKRSEFAELLYNLISDR